MKKMLDWLKYILALAIITISFIFLYKISKFEGLISEGGGFNINSILLNNIIFMKLFFVLGSISSFIISLFYIINIFLFIKFSQNKNTVPAGAKPLVQDRLNYLPQFIKVWVKFIEKMSKYEDKGYFIEFYLRLIILYLLIFLMCVTILIKLVG